MMLSDNESNEFLFAKLQLQLHEFQSELERTPQALINAPKARPGTPERELHGMRSLGSPVRIASESVGFSPSSVSTGVTDRHADALAARLEQAGGQLRDFQKATETQIAACHVALSEVAGLLGQSERCAKHVENEVVVLEEGAKPATAAGEFQMARGQFDAACAEHENDFLEIEAEFNCLQSARRENIQNAPANMNSEIQHVETSRGSAAATLSATPDGAVYAEEHAVQIRKKEAALEACKDLLKAIRHERRAGRVSRKVESPGAAQILDMASQQVDSLGDTKLADTPSQETDPLRVAKTPDIAKTVANIRALCIDRPRLEFTECASDPVSRRDLDAKSAIHGLGAGEPATHYVWEPPEVSEVSNRVSRVDLFKPIVKERVVTLMLDADKPHNAVSNSSSLSQIARSALYGKFCFKGRSRSNEALRPPLKENSRHSCGKHCSSGSQFPPKSGRSLRVDLGRVKCYPERPRTASPARRSDTTATGEKGTPRREPQKELFCRSPSPTVVRRNVPI